MAKHQEHHEEAENDERWLITYADMITLLMVFFIVLFSMANTDLKKFAAVSKSMSKAFNVIAFESSGAFGGSMVGESSGGSASGEADPAVIPRTQQQKDFMAVTAELTEYATQANLASDISVNATMEGMIISLSNRLIFESGSAELKSDAQEALHKVAEVLREIKNPVRIVGHTDDTPTNDARYPTNWELSVARSVAIVRFLIEKEQFAPEQLLAAGKAEFDPIDPNITVEGRMRNRRADIIIIYPVETSQFSIAPSLPE